MVSKAVPDAHMSMVLKRGLLAYIVIFFYADIAIYLSLVVSARLQPQYWIGLFVVFAIALAWFSRGTRVQVLRIPVFFWCVLFLALTLIFFFMVPTSHAEQLKERVRDVVLLTTFLGVFLMLRDDLDFLRKLVLLAVLVGAIVNLASLFHSDLFPLAGAKWAFRPSGFYSQPNEAGIALTLGMLLSVSELPQRWRAPYVICVLAGVAVTFSREAVIGWIVAVICLYAFKVIRWKPVILYGAVLIVCAVGAYMIVGRADFIHPAVSYAYYFDLRRFYGIFIGIHDDASVMDRWEVLKVGWASFLAHPFLGNGIGYTYHWSLPISTHNMYLLYMDDYGIIGFFLYPSLIWCMIHKAAGETRKLAWVMAIFLLFWGFFDHNIVQNYYSLFAIALTAAMVKISADEAKQVKVAQPGEAASA